MYHGPVESDLMQQFGNTYEGFVAHLADDDNPQYLRDAADWVYNLFDQEFHPDAADPELGYEEFHAIDEVAVYLEEDGDRERVTIGEVADRFYDEVERRIKLEDYEPPLHGSAMRGDNGAKRKQKEQQANQDFQDWLNDLSNVNATMETTLNRGTRYEKTHEYKLSPRTDFRFDDVQTAPSVIKVMDDGAMRYAIRIWEQYDDEDIYERVHKRMDLSTVDPDVLGDDVLHRLTRYGKHFNRNSHDDAFYRSIGTDAYDPDAFRGGITMVPELYLETALHMEDGVYEQGVPPVTPYNIKVMDVEEDRKRAFVLRPWLFNTFDGGISHDAEKERLATFYGTCQALNLVGCFDRGNRSRAEFYDDTHNDKIHTVFIDPELWAYTDRERWFMGADWDDFSNQLEEHGNATDSFITDVKKRKWEVAETVEQRYNGDLLEEMPRSIDRDLFPDAKQVDVAAPQD